MIERFLEQHRIWIDVFTLVAIGGAAFFAWTVGVRQNEINEAIQRIEDSVEIYAYPRNYNNGHFLLVTNVGRLQVYITSYKIGDGELVDTDKALIPAGQQQGAWFSFKLPTVEKGEVVDITLHIEDQIAREWRSSIDTRFEGDDVGWVDTVVHRIELVDE